MDFLVRSWLLLSYCCLYCRATSIDSNSRNALKCFSRVFLLCCSETHDHQHSDAFSRESLYQETQDISVGLGLLDQSSSQMVGTNPFTEFTNVLTVQGNGLSSDLVEFVTSQNNLRSIDGRRKDSKFGLRSHLQTRSTCANRAGSCCGGAGSLRNHKGWPSRCRNAKSVDCRSDDGEEDGKSLVCLHFCK